MDNVVPFPLKGIISAGQIMPFEEFYEKYSAEVLYYLQKKTGNREISEDLHSEIFLYCYEHYSSYDSKKSAQSTWLYLITNSRLKNYYRSRRETVEWSELEEFLFDEKIDLDHSVYLEEIRSALAIAIRKLSDVQQKVILMRFFKNREFEEIARELGTSPGNIRVIQTRALAKLREECRANGLKIED